MAVEALNFSDIEDYNREKGYLVLAFKDNLPTEPMRIRIDSWGQGLGLYYWRENNWVRSRLDPGFSLLHVKDESGESQNKITLNLGIPKGICALASRFQGHQYTVLRLLNRGDLAMHMAKHNPMLLFLLAGDASDHELPDHELERHLKMSRRQLLGTIMGWDAPAAPWMPRYLAKIMVPEYDEEFIFYCRKSLEQPKVSRALRDLLEIKPEFIFRALWLDEFLESKLLVKAKGDVRVFGERLRAIQRYGQDAVRLASEMGLDGIDKEVFNCRTTGQLSRIHDRVLREYRAFKMDELVAMENRGFPDPPFSGNESIIPIICTRELFRESFEMNHCVETYADRILDGESYIYKILKPQRATLEILKPYGKQALGELSLSHNRQPAEETYEYVQRWFEREKTCKSKSALTSLQATI